MWHCRYVRTVVWRKGRIVFGGADGWVIMVDCIVDYISLSYQLCRS